MSLGARGVRVEADDGLRGVQDLGGGHQEGAVPAFKHGSTLLQGDAGGMAPGLG